MKVRWIVGWIAWLAVGVVGLALVLPALVMQSGGDRATFDEIASALPGEASEETSSPAAEPLEAPSPLPTTTEPLGSDRYAAQPSENTHEEFIEAIAAPSADGDFGGAFGSDIGSAAGGAPTGEGFGFSGSGTGGGGTGTGSIGIGSIGTVGKGSGGQASGSSYGRAADPFASSPPREAVELSDEKLAEIEPAAGAPLSAEVPDDWMFGGAPTAEDPANHGRGNDLPMAAAPDDTALPAASAPVISAPTSAGPSAPRTSQSYAKSYSPPKNRSFAYAPQPTAPPQPPPAAASPFGTTAPGGAMPPADEDFPLAAAADEPTAAAADIDSEQDWDTDFESPPAGAGGGEVVTKSFSGKAAAKPQQKSITLTPPATSSPTTKETELDEAELAESTPSIAEPEDPFAEVDRILAGLPLGNIAFNTPERIPLGENANIELVISLQEAEQELRRAVRGPGPVETSRVRVSPYLEATLSGVGCEIESSTPARQMLSREQRTRWRWQIEPTKADDELELTLTLSALFTHGGMERTRAIRTFEKIIVVEVPITHRVAMFLSGNMEWLGSLVIIPVLGGLYRHRKRFFGPKGNTPPPPEEPAAESERQAA